MTGKYPVGYGRPPQHTRFRKGHSGNPHGRPKKRTPQGLAADLDRTLCEMITIVENGKKLKITKQQALTKRIVSESLKGDAKMMRLLIQMSSIVQAFRDAPARHAPDAITIHFVESNGDGRPLIQGN